MLRHRVRSSAEVELEPDQNGPDFCFAFVDRRPWRHTRCRVCNLSLWTLVEQ